MNVLVSKLNLLRWRSGQTHETVNLASERATQVRILTSAHRVEHGGWCVKRTIKLRMYYAYVLYSNKDKHLYIGSTPDLRKRILKHKTGRVRSTKNRRPLELIYYEAYILRVDALRREKYLKSGGGRKELSKQLDSYFYKDRL